MFSIQHADGSGECNPPLGHLSALYDELASADQEHGDVAVINDDHGWTISAHRDGRVVMEDLGNVMTRTERHMTPVPKGDVLELWHRLIDGDIQNLLKEPW